MLEVHQRRTQSHQRHCNRIERRRFKSSNDFSANSSTIQNVSSSSSSFYSSSSSSSSQTPFMSHALSSLTSSRFLVFCFYTTFFLFLSSNYFLAAANAETFLRPEIDGQVTLKAELGPYIAYETVVVKKDANLTIEPGCELRFAKASQLVVHGTLTARGTPTNRITFTKLNPDPRPYTQQQRLYNNNKYRLVEGETILDGKLQVFYNSKWHYVCSTQFNWTETDVNITCRSLGFSNGTFYYYAPANNLTSNMKIFMPRCTGNERSLFECAGTADPEVGLTVCDNQNVVGILCEGMHNEVAEEYDNWGGILFQKYAPYLKTQPFYSVFYNQSKSILEYVDVRYAGLINNTNRYKPKYSYLPTSGITVFQYAPRFNNITVEFSIGNGLNYSNIEAPAFISNSVFRFNRGHGVAAKTRFGNVTFLNSIMHDNMGDGIKYEFNNTAWSLHEQEEYVTNRYLEYCDSQNPLSYPAYYRFRNPNYVRECAKTFSTEPNMRITLHFQKTNIRSKYSTYWLEVYDGQTEQNPLIANYTFQDGKTPEAIYSRSNYMFVKLKFLCTFPTSRELQPIELQQLQEQQLWQQFQAQQYLYEQKVYKYNPPRNPGVFADRPWQLNPDEPVFPMALEQMTFDERQRQLLMFEKFQERQKLKFDQELKIKEQRIQQSRIFCPYSSFDDITMYAMAGYSKHPDLVLKTVNILNNSLSGVNATGLHSLIQFNDTYIAGNHMDGLHVHGGAGDVSLYHCQIESNNMNGVNITYAGGLKEFNYTLVKGNGLYGIYANFDVRQEFDNIFQNTTINGSIVEANILDGVWIGGYCNQSNITINATMIRENRENGLVIESCRSNDGVDWYLLNAYDRLPMTYKRRLNMTIKYVSLNISWNFFESNRLNGLRIVAIQNMIGVLTNNTFRNHRKGALQISANSTRTGDSLIRNVSLLITYNKFQNNSGRYALNVAVNELANGPDKYYAHAVQSVNITFNRFEYNTIFDPYRKLNTRSSISAVAVVSGSNVRINQNWFNNPLSRIQIATHLENHTSVINASFNWFHSLTPVYDLHYFLSQRDKCNQQWSLVRNQIFDNANRSNLAQIIYWPFACNDRLWYHESSINWPPPSDFDMTAVDSLGGVFDLGDATLPANRYTVINDIIVKPGSKLTLKSGTELNFLNGVGMLVLGELAIEGVYSSPVRFTLADQQSFALLRNMPLVEKATTTTTVAPNPYLVTTPGANFTLPVGNLTLNGSSTAMPLVGKLLGLNNDVSAYNLYFVDGKSQYEGRLMVEINGQRGTVCNKGWSFLDSQIVCHQMGYVVDPKLHVYSRLLQPDHRQTEPILMSEVYCDSLDLTIFECRHTRQQDHTCTHQDDVWVKCLKPGWAGLRYGLMAQASRMKYAIFEHAGQYDYAKAQLAPALQIDLMQHEISNLTFQQNQHNAMEILFNQPFKRNVIRNVDFISNMASGLVTRTSFLKVHQLYARNQLQYPAFEFNPYFDVKTLEAVRLFGSLPRRGYDVRRELTRLRDNQWHIGSEEMVLLYTDTEYNFGPIEMNIQIHTDNNRVVVVDLIDYNTNFEQEQVMFCEKFCQSSLADPYSREWNLSLPSNTIYFPINTSYSVLHISYNVTNLKSGRLTFLVYSVRAPEPVFDYMNPSYLYIRNIMPDNIIQIHNSTFVGNRHSIVARHYDDTWDMFGNLRIRYNFTNFIISNSTFYMNDQLFWVNTDPVIPDFHPRSNNLTIHVMHTLFESNKDDVLVNEVGYQLYDLVPSVKKGPLGRVNVTFEQCIFNNNYGGIRSLYRYHEFSNTLWHYEIRNNKFVNNKQSCIKISFPRIYRFAIKNDWENTSHSLNIRNNEFSSNELFEISIDGYYAQMNFTKNLLVDNIARIGLIKLAGTEKDFYVYANAIERNEANYIFDFEAKSHADNDYDLRSLFVDNVIMDNRKPDALINWKRLNNQQFQKSLPNDQFYSGQYYDQQSSMREAASLLVYNSPSSYTIALRGLQNCSFHRNILENRMFDYEFVGAMTANTLNSTIDATLNWWGVSNATEVAERIFDMHEWNNHALVNFIPYHSNKIDYSLSRQRPEFSIHHNSVEFVLGGLIERDLVLVKTNRPYQVRADLTVMPGVVLTIQPGVELEFYPNVGILVLGDLQASGLPEAVIKMRPVVKTDNRMPYFSTFINQLSQSQSDFFINYFNQKHGPDAEQEELTDMFAFNGNHDKYNKYGYRDAFYLNSTKRLRFFSGLTPNEGFLQIYNSTLRSWTMVCDRQFTLTTASIVCKQMGKEYRNALVKPLFYYFAPSLQQPIWNQTFICRGGEQTLAECDTFANYHMQECKSFSEYTYIMCRPYNLDKQGYEPWGGVRFAQPYFETSKRTMLAPPQAPQFLKPDLQQPQPDSSFMSYVEITGAGRLHDELNPALQLISRTPLITNVDIKDSVYHGLEFVQSRSTATFNKIRVTNSLGFGVNSVQLNVQTTDQKSSFGILNKNWLSNQNIYSMIDICDPHKYYNVDQRIIVFYKYSNLARDCVKIFRTRLGSSNAAGAGQLGIRFLQLLLVNNTVQNDTIEIYNGTLFQQRNLMATLNNGSTSDAYDRFYVSRTDSLSMYMKASVGREYFGFIAEVLLFPTAQYLSPETYIEFSDSELVSNQLGAVNYVTAGERNPHLYLLRNRFISNGFEYFNTTSPPVIDLVLQNTPKFYFGNNYVSHNFGGFTVRLYSGSGVLITRSLIFNNLFSENHNDTILCTRGELTLPYNELTIYKNLFVENKTPRTDVVLVSGLVSEFTRNQLIYNVGARILFTQGFENVSTPRNQDITYNMFRDNYAHGIFNELEDANRFRSTMVAASLKQVYYANYLFNKDNDFEMTALVDPYVWAFLQDYYKRTAKPVYWDPNGDYIRDYLNSKDKDYTNRYLKDYPKDYIKDLSMLSRVDQENVIVEEVEGYETTTRSEINPPNLPGLVAYSEPINASFNFWGSVVDTEIRARIRDRYDNLTLFEIAYSPAVIDQFKIRDGKCELGWSLIDDTCYTYIGSYVSYREAENLCMRFESRLARETVAPIKLPRFRQLARTSQYNYEASTYRRMWLYTDVPVGGDDVTGTCSVIEDFGVSSSNCAEKLPFICEKDPVFLGATFRFKDEIAFAIAAAGALLVCIILLSLLWFYKSRRRKKEHIDRQNTLRTSARALRHMVSNPNSTLSTANSSSMLNSSTNKSSAIYGLNTGTDPSSGDKMSSNRSLSIAGRRSGGGGNGGIYNSQRNQYFASKRFKKGSTANDAENGSNSSQNQLKDESSASSLKEEPTPQFNANGLDNNEGASYYGAARPSDPASMAYHMYDSNSLNKQSNDEDDDDQDTTTDEITDDTGITRMNSNRFALKEHSPADSSTRTAETFADIPMPSSNFNGLRQSMHSRNSAAKMSPPGKQSTPNLAASHFGQNPNNFQTQRSRNYNPTSFISSYDQIINTTMDTEDDEHDANSRRLLTNKVNSSTIMPHHIPPYSSMRGPQQPRPVSSVNYPPPPPISHMNSTSTFRSRDNLDAAEPPPSVMNTFSRPLPESALNKSTTNMTNMTSLTSITNNSQINMTPHHQGYQMQNNSYPSQPSPPSKPMPRGSDYENLSNLPGNNRFQPQPPRTPGVNSTPMTFTRQNVYTPNTTAKGNQLLQVAGASAGALNMPSTQIVNSSPAPPPPPISSIPAISHFRLNQKHHNDSSVGETDEESVMSCQLITSASLLVNRDAAREAERLAHMKLNTGGPGINAPRGLVPQARRQFAPPQLDPRLKSQPFHEVQPPSNQYVPYQPQQRMQPPSQPPPAPPILNPRQLLTTNQASTQIPTPQQIDDADVQHANPDGDASKPPPMETAI